MMARTTSTPAEASLRLACRHLGNGNVSAMKRRRGKSGKSAFIREKLRLRNKICRIDTIHLFSVMNPLLKFIAVKQEGVVMLRTIMGLLLLIACSAPAFAQAAKGVDKQNERVRDSGSERTPANNGNKTDVGTGRGIDFGSGRTPEVVPLPNPYRLSGRRDVIIHAVQELMRDRKLVVDESASKISEGIIVSQPFTFTKGAVNSAGDLSRYAGIPAS